MATYAIGDVQGCDRTLGRLLARIDFDPAQDRLWFVGDLVNRGPDSLAVLRRVRALGDRAVTVLGNHDLHLLARFDGARRAKRLDTLDEVLAAPDAPDLVEWLRARPLLHREGAHLMVHAGLLSTWTVEVAEAQARSLEARVRLGDVCRGDAAMSALTRLRFVDAAGEPDYGPKFAPEEAPPGLRPWFEARGAEADLTVVFGHWAALGLSIQPGYIGLDTGCVWGDRLTALRLEDRAVIAEPSELGATASGG